ncbi:Spherulation-specific family 4 [Pseudoneurospora amorphoporcata]|uniref:Spherulation-specific family 4 n=1 Tax=Pseudoneurospora amorphoporcata TaxID=241081 RepID=A0AAN6SI54_9PEZI|nr:Spherulation-specific family 4 [Pseudoneurospora amorphoporcata]
MSTILVPLYIYPSSSGLGWSPLFSALTTALERNPSLEFLVVINPGNGPGPDYPIPNADYRAALSRLSDLGAYPNVKVIGYVHCNYGERELGEIERDIEDYLAWLDFDERGEWAIRLDGIFVDEVPIDTKHLDYLQCITDTVRSGFTEVASRRSHCNSSSNVSTDNSSSSASSPTPSTTGIVIHNPGIFPSADSSDAFFSSRLVDYVVVFENCLAAWWDSGDYVSANLALLTPEKRAKAIAVAHTCGCGPKSQAGSSGCRPQQQEAKGHHTAGGEGAEKTEKDAIKKNVGNFLDEVVTQHNLAGHFATSATDYATWCSGWEGYVEVACDLTAATC